MAVVSEDPFNRLLNIRIEVHGVEDFHVWMHPGYLGQGVADVLEPLAEVFAAMAGDENQPFVRVKERKSFVELRPEIRLLFDHPDNGQERVDDRVAGNEDGLLRDPFPKEVLPCRFGRSKVQVRERARNLAVDLFGERRILIMGAESCLHVSDLDLAVVSGKGGRHGRGGIAMDQDHVRPFFFQDRLEPL